MSRILIIDDDRAVCDILATFILFLGHEVDQALDLTTAYQMLAIQAYDVVILDVRLPDGNGLEAIPRIKHGPSSPEVIIITGESSEESAQLAIESGSWDYLQKPLSTDRVNLTVTRVLQYREEKTGAGSLLLLQRDAIIGSSQLLRECLIQVARAALTQTNVLISGETGTGKELFARAIHENSLRAQQPFVVIDCSALPETLAESVLFGHIKGTFSAADQTTAGLISQANGGTLFLDEIGELPPSIQSALLRVLQERRFRPVGSKHEVASDFRLVAATNRNLNEMVREGLFRNDLLFRLKSFVIHLPSLRQHIEDAMELSLHFIAQFSQRNSIGMKGLSPEFYEALHSYPWPGNIRELANAIEAALLTAKDEPILYSIHLPVHIRAHLARYSVITPSLKHDAPAAVAEEPQSFPTLKVLVERVTRKYLENLIAHTDGNMHDVCRISGVSRANIYSRLKRLRIPKRN